MQTISKYRRRYKCLQLNTLVIFFQFEVILFFMLPIFIILMIIYLMGAKVVAQKAGN